MTQIDLSQYPPPEVLESLSFEAILTEIKAEFISQFPTDSIEAAERGVPSQAEVSMTLTVEGNLVLKTLQAYAYHALIMRQRVNDAAKATMLTEATGTDLDNLASFYGVQRNIVIPGDETAVPPVDPVYEGDEVFRRRIIPAVDGFSTAGPVKAYQYWASTVPGVKDSAVTSPVPGQVLVSILTYEGDGVPTAEILSDVEAVLSHEDIRPLTDQVIVQAGTVQDYTVTAQIYLYGGNDQTIVLAAAEAAVAAYVDDVKRLGFDVTRSGLFRALHQAGVQNVVLTSPAADLVMGETEAGNCTAINITFGGIDV